MQTMQSQLMPALSATRLYSSSPAVAWPSGLGKLNLLETHAWKFEILVQQVLRRCTQTQNFGTHIKNYLIFSEILGSSQKFVAGPQFLDFKVVTLNDFWLQQCKMKL